MLVLSRKLGEQVVIPHCELTVTVVAIEGNSIRLGFTAPRSVEVYRQELLQKMRDVQPAEPMPRIPCANCR